MKVHGLDAGKKCKVDWTDANGPTNGRAEQDAAGQNDAGECWGIASTTRLVAH